MGRLVIGLTVAVAVAVSLAAVLGCGGTSSSRAITSPSAKPVATPTPFATLNDPIVLKTDKGGQIQVRPLNAGTNSLKFAGEYTWTKVIWFKLSIKNVGTSAVHDDARSCAALIGTNGISQSALKWGGQGELGDFTIQPGEKVVGDVFFRRSAAMKTGKAFPNLRYATDAGIGSQYGDWTFAGYTIP
jgi:archaellum component FlaG (FlaF/FlaG flagellin family)